MTISPGKAWIDIVEHPQLVFANHFELRLEDFLKKLALVLSDSKDLDFLCRSKCNKRYMVIDKLLWMKT